MRASPRPTGVTLLAILSTIGGLFSLVLGGLFLLGGALFASLLLVALGVGNFFLAIGYLDGSAWAWILGLVFGSVNIVGSLVQIVFGLGNGIVSIIFSGITIYYLTRPRVRGFFGKGQRSLAIPENQSGRAVLPMATNNNSTKRSSIARPCQKCGAMLPPRAGFCRTCGAVQ